MAVRLVINMGLELVELVELELVDSSGVTDRGWDGFSWGVAVDGTPGNQGPKLRSVELKSYHTQFPTHAEWYAMEWDPRVLVSKKFPGEQSSHAWALSNSSNYKNQLIPFTNLSKVLSLRSWVGKQSSKHGKPPAPRWFPEKLASCGQGYCGVTCPSNKNHPQSWYKRVGSVIL